MIIKNYEINKIDYKISKLFLLYGDNEGFKNEIIDTIYKKRNLNRFNYYENEILKNLESFFNSISSGSLFDKEKFIVIKKASDKIKNVIDEIISKKYEDFIIVIESDLLDKKSKLRNLFEKDKNLICIPFYPDTNQNLNAIAINFFKEKKINISTQSINLLVERANCKRQNLKNELNKISIYLKEKKTINFDEILKLTNLAGEYDVSLLIDSCFKNKRN